MLREHDDGLKEHGQRQVNVNEDPSISPENCVIPRDSTDPANAISPFLTISGTP